MLKLEGNLKYHQVQLTNVQVIKLRPEEGKGCISKRVTICQPSGIPWQSSSQDSVLPTPGTQFQSLVGELRFHKPGSEAKQKKTNPIITGLKIRSLWSSFVKYLSHINTQVTVFISLLTYILNFKPVCFSVSSNIVNGPILVIHVLLQAW